MFVPEGLTAEKTIAAIDKVSGRLSQKFAFACYTADDLKQQCFVWALENLHKVEPGRPLENFLQVILKNKLRNLKRDKLRRAEVPCPACDAGDFCNNGEPCSRHTEWSRNNKSKTDIMFPIHLESVNEEDETTLQQLPSDSCLEGEELSERITQQLHPRLRADYLRMVDGAVVPSERRKAVRDAVRVILWEDFFDG